MPPKIRELKSALAKAGFTKRQQKEAILTGYIHCYQEQMSQYPGMMETMRSTIKSSKYGKRLRNGRHAMKEAHYSMIITWDEEDKIFVVKVPELDGCMTHGQTYEEAVKNGKEAMDGWIEVANSLGWTLPQPHTTAA